jgi:Holliday junction resolvasome RuvABC ATP-dependent DNA helicase subunit
MLELLIIIGIIFIVTYINKNKKPIIKSSENDFNNYHVTLKEMIKSDNSVTLKTPSFDVNKIQEYQGIILKAFEFRPKTFEQFIGQKDAKEKACTIIKKFQAGMKAHLLVNGIQGHGKTTFVEILGYSLGAKIISRVGKQIDEINLIEIINEINTSQEKNIMLFIDELDTMDWKVLKVLNPIIESFEIAGKKIKPFIFAGATINKHKLLIRTPDTMDRIGNHIIFERYNNDEIKQILVQYKDHLYQAEFIPGEVFDIISKNCKFNPRISLSLLEDYIIEKNIEKVMQNNKIIKNGLTKKDIEILQALSTSKRAIGSNALAMKVKLSEKEYITEFEPFLVEYDYINRIPSRIITDKGKQILEEINEKKVY